MDVTESKAKVHVLLYPFLGFGHIIPLLDLAQRLLTRGISVTVLVTPPYLPLLDSILAVHPSSLVHPLVVPFQPSTACKDWFINVMRGLRESHYPAIIQWFRAHHNPPVAIVSDFLIGWSHHLARELGIKRIVFSPSGGFSNAVTNSLWRELPEIGDPDDVEGLMESPSVPGRPIYPLWQVSRPYLRYKGGDPDFDFFREEMLGNSASWGVVYNSFTELEGQYLDHTKNVLGHDRVWAVGPLFSAPHESVGPTERGGGATVSNRDLITWLDARADGSVVYVCFGSITMLTRAQMEPLAEALERSGVNFLWCMPREKESHEGNVGAIPEGFEDRQAERGFVVKGWAPQLAILRHRAVGAFITHCGWNSTLEGISAGTIMLTWPQWADQFTNAKLLDQLGVGVRVGEGTRKIPDPTELARILKECVDENGRKEEKIRAKEMSEKANMAVQGGSSEKQLDGLIQKLSELKIEK